MWTIDVVVLLVTRVAALCLAGAFIARYRRQDWRGTDEGRHLMGGTAMILSVLIYLTTLDVAIILDEHLTWFTAGQWPAQHWVASGFNVWVAYELRRRNRLLTAAQRWTRRDRR